MKVVDIINVSVGNEMTLKNNYEPAQQNGMPQIDGVRVYKTPEITILSDNNEKIGTAQIKANSEKDVKIELKISDMEKFEHEGGQKAPNNQLTELFKSQGYENIEIEGIPTSIGKVKAR